MESEATSQEKNGGGITLSQRDESGCNEFFCGMFYVVLINELHVRMDDGCSNS